MDRHIPDQDKRRRLDLLAKQQQGKLSVAERDELKAFLQADNRLSILRAKTILALKTADLEH